MILPPIKLEETEPPTSASITTLPVKKRIELSHDRVLTEVHSYKCQHVRFTIDEKLAQVECRDCKALLEPIWALRQLARQETRFHELHDRYQDEMKRLSERKRTKCEHCNQMTRISSS